MIDILIKIKNDSYCTYLLLKLCIMILPEQNMAL